MLKTIFFLYFQCICLKKEVESSSQSYQPVKRSTRGRGGGRGGGRGERGIGRGKAKVRATQS